VPFYSGPNYFDKHFINTCFADDGGVNRFDKILDQKLDQVLNNLAEAIWSVQSA
jgi:type I restriction enzyme R subunit